MEPSVALTPKKAPLQNLGRLNEWKKKPTVVDACQRMGHNIIEIAHSSTDHERRCESDECRYQYRHYLDMPVANSEVLSNPHQAVLDATSKTARVVPAGMVPLDMVQDLVDKAVQKALETKK